MSLGYVISEVASAVGLTSLELNPDQRKWLINKINRAAEELWEQDDLPGSLKECFIQAKSNVELALPPFVGELRAAREAFFKEPIRLQDLRPKYHTNSWPNEWHLFRYKGYSPVKTEIINATLPTAKILIADPSITVTIVGSTIDANRVSESKDLSSANVTFDSSFISYESITLNKLPKSNIQIFDADNNELAIIYNDTLAARYALYDISNYPYTNGFSSTCAIFEIVYKIPLKCLENDSDSFPVDGFDNILVVKSLQTLTEGEEGKEQRAILMDTKAARLIKKKIEHKTGSVEKILNYPRRKTLGLFSSYNYWDY